MSSNRGRFLVSSLLSVLFVSFALGQQPADVPLRNWTIPPYRLASGSGGLSPMTDISPGVGFVAITPCRVADTRGLGFTGQAGPPAINTGVRTFQILGTVAGIPTQCGISNGAVAVSFQFTIVSPNTAGNLIAWPAFVAAPTVSVLNWSAGITAVGNGTIVPVNDDGYLSVQINAAVGTATAHLVIDVNGYFTDTLIAPNQFVIVGNVNNDSTLHVDNQSTAVGSRAILGMASATTGATYGVFGMTNSDDGESAGVRGRDGSGSPLGTLTFESAGVRGESRFGYGVLGISVDSGVSGFGVNGTGDFVAAGYLGRTGGGGYGVTSNGDAHVQGTFTASNNKGFVQPHPHDASKEIRYISLEGPHTEVYFRGTAQVSQGVTRIPVPEHFRFVADPATYSTLVTPAGGMATVGVLSEGPGGIVVQASRNIKIHYVVYAEREAVRNPDPIIENVHFRPEPGWEFLAHLPESFLRLMIQNGTLNPDRTLNMETAHRLGWDKQLEERARPAPQPTE
jgi:hypothetical protein